MCLKSLNEQWEAYEALKKKFEGLKRNEIVFAIIACLACIVYTVCVYINGPYSLNNMKIIEPIRENGNRGVDILSPDDYRKKYDEKVVKFNNHLEQTNRTKNGIRELRRALSVLNEIKEIESRKTVYIEEKKAIQLTEDLKRKCDELKNHFNEMRFSDDEFVKREGEQLYNEVENIKRQL